MSGPVASTTDRSTASLPRRPRPPWRQHLIDAERGFAFGLRNNSAFAMHFFCMCVVTATATVLGLTPLEWGVVILAVTLVLSAELFHQVLRVLWKDAGPHLPGDARYAVQMGTAAVLVTLCGATTTVIVIFASRIIAMFSGG
ncbi:Prokaryotic diacylglycerol kinase [Maioricimonas rarisocia]|uniref:Prokaryotic diacylglycerol kinase n=1 Tax=Maioricimonas rarisocia TaxID=2528026 RepID=A0A517Z3Y4_9PLAN|nr:diacylglycerol kinase [Maioricimonas rarisocia]QDU37137.1 Prokaryotic diacylglycerol kinase [Maioricimonas rarisocia]